MQSLEYKKVLSQLYKVNKNMSIKLYIFIYLRFKKYYGKNQHATFLLRLNLFKLHVTVTNFTY